MQQEPWDFQFAFGALLKGLLGFFQAAEGFIAVDENDIREGKVRIELDRFLRFLDCLFVLARDLVNCPDKNPWGSISRG